MAVKIGSARSSYGNTGAGDQSGGREVSTQAWYLHSKGWIVLRAKDLAVREKIALAMERACENNDIGYSQATRNTLRNDIKDKGFDPACTTKKVNCDCSSLVRVCCNFAGIEVGDFITSNEVKRLMATGAFVKFTDEAHCKSSDRLLRGDILDTCTKGHTVVVLDNGAKADEEAEPEVSAAVEVTGEYVNLRKGPGTEYDAIKTMRKGAKLELAKPDGWVPVLYRGAVCWISAQYVQEAAA